VTAQIGAVGQPTGSPAQATFRPGAPDWRHSTLEVSPETVLNNGTNTNWAKLWVRDVNDNPVPDADVVFRVETGPQFTGSHIAEQTAKTADPTGVANVELTSTVPGSFLVEGFIGADRVDGKPVTFSPGVAKAAYSTWTLTPNATLVADGTQAFTATITAISNNLLPVPGARVQVVPDPANTDLVFSESGPLTTGPNGTASVQVTSTKSGTFPLAALVGQDQIPGGTKPARFKAGPAVASHSRLEAPTSAAVAGSGTQEVTAWVNDRFDNPATEGAVVFTVPTNPAGLSPSGQVTVPIANGKAVLVLSSPSVGSWDVTASVNGESILSGSPARVQFTPGAVDPNRSELTVPTAAGGATKVAYGVEEHVARVELRDAGGNPVPDTVAVRFQIGLASGGAPLVQSTVNSVNGVAELAWPSTVVGVHQVNAWVTVSGVEKLVHGSPASAKFVPGPVSYTKSRLVAPGGAVPANGKDTQTVTLIVVDDLDHPIPGQAVELIPDAALGVTRSEHHHRCQRQGLHHLDLHADWVVPGQSQGRWHRARDCQWFSGLGAVLHRERFRQQLVVDGDPEHCFAGRWRSSLHRDRHRPLRGGPSGGQ